MNDDPRNYLTADGRQRTILGVSNDAAFIDNPYWSVYNNPSNSNVNRIITTLNLDYNPFSFLNVTYRAGTDFFNEEFTSIRGAGTVIGGEERGYHPNGPFQPNNYIHAGGHFFPAYRQ